MRVIKTVILRSCCKVNIMIILWLVLITSITGQEATRPENNDEAQVLNVTTLYPVSKNIKNTLSNVGKTVEGKTTWKLEATFGQTDVEQKTDDIEDEKYSNIKIAEKELKEINNNITNADEEGRDINNNVQSVEKEANGIKNNSVKGKAAGIHNNTEIADDEERVTNDCNDFKPSLQLGSFFEDEEPEVPSHVKKPDFQFLGLHQEGLKSSFKPSPEDIQIPKDFPYKFDNTIYKSKDIWRPDILESRPTVEIPVRVPAGGLYKLEDPFTVHPSSLHSSFDEEYGLEITENLKEKYIKKRVDPWRSVFRLMTALVPAGLIISALTPSVISIHSTGPEARHRSRLVRRSDAIGFELPTISEDCRRRLLCELHSEVNYKKSQTERRKGTYCYKIQCDDPQAVWRMLHWLLTYHQPRNKDERGRYVT